MAITISLSPKHYQFIQCQVQYGRYSSANEVMSLASELPAESRYLEDNDNRLNYEKCLEETRNRLAVGIEQADRGQLTDVEAVLAWMREKVRKFDEAQA